MRITILSFVFYLFSITNIFSYIIPTDIIGKDARNLNSKKTRVQFQLDFRNSFLGKNNSPISIYGLNIGVKLKNRYRIGIGGYFTNQRTPKEVPLLSTGRVTPQSNGNLTETPRIFAFRELRIEYVTLNFAYSIIQNRYFELQIPLELGVGSYFFQYYNARVNDQLAPSEKVRIQGALDNNLLEKLDRRGIFFPVLGGATLTIKLHRWLYPNVSLGYRKILNETDLRFDFDGIYYHFGAEIHFLEMYYDWKERKKKPNTN
ncbi:MAG: hypothetical protein SFY32_08660 [Bacteroidota bacterium]|nr:hypothetical protein [Bacteroidota bacterium]